MRFGYCRVSSFGQSNEIQVEELNKHVCERIIQEKASGKDMDNRPELIALLNFMREGDELYVTKIDRLARSVPDLCDIAKRLDAKGCRLVITQQQMDTGSTYGRFMLHIIGAVAEFENALRRERQRAGIDKWLEKVRAGDAKPQRRTPKFNAAEIRRLHHHNMTVRDIARKLGCTPQTCYRVLQLGAPNPARSRAAEPDAHFSEEATS